MDKIKRIKDKHKNEYNIDNLPLEILIKILNNKILIGTYINILLTNTFFHYTMSYRVELYKTLKSVCIKFNIHYKNINNHIVIKLCNDNKNLKIIKYLCDKFDIKIDNYNYNYEILKKMCENGCLNIIKYFDEKYNKTIDSIIKEDYCSSFLSIICKKGHLDILEYLFEKLNFLNCRKVSYFEEYVREACKNGYLDIVKFFCEKYDFNICGDDDFLNGSNSNRSILIKTCERGHIHIVKYLCEKFNIKDYAALCAFNQACINCHFDIAIWLLTYYNLSRIKIDDGNVKKVIKLLCQNGYIDHSIHLVKNYLVEHNEN
jgi:hypothetical protein